MRVSLTLVFIFSHFLNMVNLPCGHVLRASIVHNIGQENERELLFEVAKWRIHPSHDMPQDAHQLVWC